MSDVFSIRRENLKALISQYPSTSAFARQADMSSAQVRQLVNASPSTGAFKTCGEKLARKIEDRLGLNVRWLDAEHGEEGEPGALRLPGVAGEVASATQKPTQEHEQVHIAGLTPLQRAVVDALLKVCRTSGLSDRECVELLDSWKEKLS